jgi:YgiT-type zinc finger domain-containing protein
MKCPLCHNGELRPGTSDETVSYEGMTLVVKGVPAEICDTSGAASPTSTSRSPSGSSTSPERLLLRASSWTSATTSQPDPERYRMV